MLAINVNHFYFNLQGNPDPEFPNGIANPVRVNRLILTLKLIYNMPMPE